VCQGREICLYHVGINAINDVPCTTNPWLLTKVLRQDWGFNGYGVSDCGVLSLLVSAMKYVKKGSGGNFIHQSLFGFGMWR
jgi:beta-glucosidase-like glycosyl hydrolase